MEKPNFRLGSDEQYLSSTTQTNIKITNYLFKFVTETNSIYINVI